jgi:ATP-dependent helicase/nuclease subunit A
VRPARAEGAAVSPLADADARQAIATQLERNVVVEAAAGTGKTTEMVRRIVALIAAGRATVDRIVAMTFTEKAAGEMKLRIRTQLERSRQSAGAGTPERDRLESAIAHLEEAWVGTIHGFCAEILRERSVDAGVDPGFEVLDEREARRLFGRTFHSWFEAMLYTPTEGVRRSLRRRGRDDDDDPVRRLGAAAWRLAEWRDLSAPWRRPPFAREAEIDGLVEQLHAFAELSERCSRPKDDGLYLDTAPARTLSREILRAERVRPRDYDGIEAELVGLPGRRGGKEKFGEPRTGRAAAYGPELTRAAVQAAHATLVVALKTFAVAADADLAACLHRELTGVLERYQEAKRSRGRIDYLDLLLRARDLVRDRPAVRVDFARRFTHFFVDEFQDTDLLQAELLLLLISQDPAERDWRRVVPGAGRLFVVGDPKQAIYRFRRADLAVYQEVRELLIRRGALDLHLTASFRSVPSIQNAVNRAFAFALDGDRASLQASYLPLDPVRAEHPDQPSLVALPIPAPHGAFGVTARAIAASLPAAVAAWVEWLTTQSGWTVTEGHDGARVPVAPRHVCLLFRRFVSFGEDITRPYLEELEHRGIRHLLVGGRSFHERSEVEALRTALTAIEWPDDELSVFATLRGPLIAIGDEELLEFRHRHGRLHPFRPPVSAVDARLQPIIAALELLAGLHRERNRRPVAETIVRLLEQTRAHAGFALQQSGEQVLANVLHLAEQARSFERSGGLSFRGFVTQLAEDAETADTGEAPILEDGSDGVRVMTLHKAKGLEFPVVILADPAAHLHGWSAERKMDLDRNLCALKIAGCMPWDLIEAREAEMLKDRAEGVRIAYVAATRARDVLVVPAVGDEIWGRGDGRLEGRNRPTWLSPLLGSIYPESARWRDSTPADGCPEFGEESALRQPGDPDAQGVRPGRHTMNDFDVVWWDPHALDLQPPPRPELRHQDLLDPESTSVETDLERYRNWERERAALLATASEPWIRVATATAAAAEGTDAASEIEILRAGPGSPSGARFGTLVHSVLATVPLDADRDRVAQSCRLQARVLGATESETVAAAEIAVAALEHPLLERARAAWRVDRCRREIPLSWCTPEGIVLEGQADLAFEEDDGWIVVDFKTGREVEIDAARHRRQVALYARAIAAATGRPARGILLAL